ncbi:MAG TPA: Xaa-Pro peptidase family protein [Spirochaetia bacterium]|nr:Xaa-Pro peptidase family protein [Spirochaetia bacterium]
MLTSQGCRLRRDRLCEKLAGAGPLLLGDPLNLRYFAAFSADPFSLAADSAALLLVQPDGRSTLYYESRLAAAAALAHVDERVMVPWYDGASPGRGPARLALRSVLDGAGTGGRVHDSLADPLAPDLWNAVGQLRRAKDPDEVDQLRECVRVAEAGHRWARANAKAGLTEMQVYEGIFAACAEAAGRPAVVYGDIVVSPGPARTDGRPTRRVLEDGDLLIVDFSVVLQGYRSDFTNTLCIGGRPTTAQARLYDQCAEALSAGERVLAPGARCIDVYGAVRRCFEAAGVAEHFPHHAGHGLGLSHPEAPFFVPGATETLAEGDVVTLEPGLYVDGVGGIRVEHNYLVTARGFETLSHHLLGLR